MKLSQTLPTGIPALDQALGIGGLPRGKFVEIYGRPDVGKTTLALTICATVQRAGGCVAFIDTEHALNPPYADMLGVDMSRLLVTQPDCGEQALDMVESLVRTGTVDLIVVDSVAALVPRVEVDNDLGFDQGNHLLERLMVRALRKLVAQTNKTNTTLLFINQLEPVVGVTFGSPEITTGGSALRYYASVRMDIRLLARTNGGSGFQARIKIIKNKMAAPFAIAEHEFHLKPETP